MTAVTRISVKSYKEEYMAHAGLHHHCEGGDFAFVPLAALYYVSSF